MNHSIHAYRKNNVENIFSLHTEFFIATNRLISTSVKPDTMINSVEEISRNFLCAIWNFNFSAHIFQRTHTLNLFTYPSWHIHSHTWYIYAKTFIGTIQRRTVEFFANNKGAFPLPPLYERHYSHGPFDSEKFQQLRIIQVATSFQTSYEVFRHTETWKIALIRPLEVLPSFHPPSANYEMGFTKGKYSIAVFAFACIFTFFIFRRERVLIGGKFSKSTGKRVDGKAKRK